MGESEPEPIANDHATLEEVFTSRTFGHPLPETGAGNVVPEMVAGPKAFFVRNRFIASAAVAAAALSIVGLSIGSGHLVPPVISAHSAGSGVPSFGTTHDHDPSRSGGRGTSGSNGTGKHGYLRGRQFPRRRAAFGHRAPSRP